MDAPDAPRLTITLQLEERPRVREWAQTEEQAERLRDWIRANPELDAIAQSAILLMARRAA